VLQHRASLLQQNNLLPSEYARSLPHLCPCCPVLAALLRSELHQLLQLANLLDEHSTTISSLNLSFILWHNTQTAQLLASLIAQHGCKLAGLSVDFKACAADLSGGLRAGSIEAAAAAEETLAEALQQAAADAGEQGEHVQRSCLLV
jgi:hypothetical protein